MDNKFPIFIFEDDDACVYGLPDVGTGVKIGLHFEGKTVDLKEDLYKIKYGVDMNLAKRLH